jgi:hypothetical protein
MFGDLGTIVLSQLAFGHVTKVLVLLSGRLTASQHTEYFAFALIQKLHCSQKHHCHVAA